VAITAARPSEGKSVLSLSVARSAALSGERVLLIDCDIRRPSLAHRLRADNSPGLADLLRGTTGLQDVLHADAMTGGRTEGESSIGPDSPLAGVRGGMHFLPAGQPRGDTFGLFMGPEMARLLSEARPEYSLVVLDSPPVQAITEARVLAAVADATILCVRWRATPRDVVSYALELLEDANAQVAGLVLTRVDPRAHVRSGYADADIYHHRYKAYFPG
jgi:polysaccharide biosynthesis transport protein